MARPIDDQNLEEEVDAALDQASHAPEPLRIVEASYHQALDLFELKISNGRRLVFARENLQPLDGATTEQAADFTTKPNGRHLWWPKLDEGLSLAVLLEGRTGNEKWMERLRRVEVAA
jgi:hypothetical protein